LILGNKAMVNSSGQMAGNTKEIGKTESKAEEDYTKELMGVREKENGKMERRLDGLGNELTIDCLMHQ